MTKKLILGIFLVLLMTGCTSDYKIKISNGKVYEELTIFEENNEYANVTDESGRSFKSYASIYGTELDLNTSFYDLYSDESCVNGCETYERSFINNDRGVGFSLNHEFDFKTYGDSTIANELLPNFEASFDGRYLMIKGGNNWKFVEGYKYLESINITIETDYKVKNTNGTKNGNKYTWTIHRNLTDETEDVYLYIDTYDKSEAETGKNNSKLAYILAIILLIALIGISYVLVQKNKKQNSL